MNSVNLVFALVFDSESRGLLATCRAGLRRLSVILLMTILAGQLAAQEAKLFEQEPFDVVTLNAQNQGRVLKTFPLALPGRRIPTNPNPNATLRIRMLNNPDEEFDLAWRGVEKIELFEERVLLEARQLTKAGRFDDAFEQLGFLQNKYPKTRGLETSVDQLLFAEASALYRERRFDRAILLLNEIYQRNPSRRGLTTALTRVSKSLFAIRMKAGDYRDARRIVSLAEEQYGNALGTSISDWKKQLQAAAAKVLRTAKQQLDDGDLRSAYMSSRKAFQIWPDTPDVRQMVAETSEKYPLLSVAVSQRYADSDVNPMFNWATRRATRLQYRRLFELVAVGPDGAEYDCPVGKAEVPDDGRSFAVQLMSEGDSTASFIGMVVARRLLQMAAPATAVYDPSWSMVLAELNLKNVDDLQIKLRRPVLRVQALLDTADISGQVESLRQAWQPYTLNKAADDAQMVSFLANERYVLAGSSQPREIVERQFDNPQQAVQALRRGEVDLVARVFPADVTQLSRDKSIVVQPYRIPSMHILVPNQERPHAGNRIFRRAMAYAIDRQKILDRDLLGGFELSGCQLVSGPFPIGIGNDDPLAYAYDARVEPLPYDPRHARTLVQLAQIGLEASAAKAKKEKPVLNELVLVHPPNEIARIACNEIVADLSILKISCRLRVLEPGVSWPDDDDWDFLYVDYVMGEPLVDARRLLASDGFARCASPHLNLALRQLDQVDSWREAGSRLRAIHQVCSDDMSVIPLWQLGDRLARRKLVDGLLEQPIGTYQDIEAWRLSAEQ